MIRRVSVALCAVLVTAAGVLSAAAPAYATAPTITSFTPTSGVIGTQVVITGTGFTAPATVSIGGGRSGYVSVGSTTRITASVGSDAATGKIAVTTAGGTATSTATFTVQPGVFLTPAVGPPTTPVTVRFSGLGASEAADVYLDTADIALVTTDAQGAASATVTVPATATAGTHWISVVGRRSGSAAQASFLVRTDWASVDANAGRSGANVYENTLSPNNVGQLDESWRTPSTGTQALTAGPIVSNGAVYATFRDGTVQAFSLATGAQLWSYTTKYNSNYAPATAGGLLLVIDGSTVLALSTSSGKVVWTKDVGTQIVADPVVYGTGVYVSGGSYVYDLAVSSGAITWSTNVGTAAYDPAVVGGRVFVVIDNSYYVVALSASSGGILWSDPINSYISSSVTVSGGFVYAGTDDGRLIAMRADNGATLWTYTHPDGTEVNPPAVAGGYLYATDNSGSAFAVNASTGALRWTYALPYGTYAYNRPVVANGVVYFGDIAGTFAYSVYGGLLWSVREGTYYYGPAVVDGSLVLGTSYGNVVRFTVNGAAAPRSAARPDPGRLRATIGA